MNAEMIMEAIGLIDDELIDDGIPCRNRNRTGTEKRWYLSWKAAAAAAIVLLFVGAAVIYGIFLAPASAVYLDARESVTITLNSRGKVLSASGHPSLDGKTAEDAVAAVTRQMLADGAISEDENTLILGTYKVSEEARDHLLEIVKNVFAQSRFHGAIVCLPCSDTGAKSAVIDLLTQLDDSLSRDSLCRLSAHELNLLLHNYAAEEVRLLGEPTKHGEPSISSRADTPDEKDRQQTADEPSAQEEHTPSPNGSYTPYTAAVTPHSDSVTDAPTEAAKRQQTDKTKPTAGAIFPTVSAPTAKPTAPTVTSTEQPTAKPAEDIRSDSLIVDIPYGELIRYIDKTPDAAYGLSIPLTPISPSWQWRMNWHTTSPPVTKSKVTQMGKQDKSITVFCSYNDFAAYHIDSSIEWSAYLQTLRNDGRFDDDFFRENALIMVWYSDFNVYANETDSISMIEINNETAYLTLQRAYRPEPSYSFETDLYKCVTAAAVKKSDIKNIKDLRLIVITRSEEE